MVDCWSINKTTMIVSNGGDARAFSGSSLSIQVGLAVATSLSLVCATWLIRQAYQKMDEASNNKKKQQYYKPPPKTCLGILETVSIMSGPDLPWQYLKLAKQLGSNIFQLNLPLPGHPLVAVVGETDAVRQILQDPLTIKPHSVYGALFDMSPSRTPSLFILNGEPWHKRRKGTAPAFSPKHVRRMNEVALQKTEEWIEERLAPLVDQDQDLDISHEMLKLVLGAFCETALDYDMSDEEMELFMHESDLANEEYLYKSITNPLRKYLLWWLPERRRARQATHHIVQVSRNIIESYRQKLASKSNAPGTVLDRIMNNPVYANDDELVSEIWAYLVAGHDTTANTLTWTLLELAKHPDEQDRLRAALLNASSSAGDDPTKCEALRLVVKESMRLNPVGAAVLARQVGRDYFVDTDDAKDDDDSRGYFLPKNTLTFLPYILLSRSVDIYGDDANVFRPDRWKNATDVMQQAYIPFALGPQNCAGQALAKAQAHSILARIVPEFEFVVSNPGTSKFFLVLKPEGVRLRAKRVKV